MKGLKRQPRLPWHDDFPLTPEQVAAILAADLPEMRGAHVVKFGDGWDYSTYLANDAWVFRFPKRRQCVRPLAREKKLLDELAAALADDAIAIPHYHYHVEKSASFALSYAGYPLVRGEPLTSVSLPTFDRTAAGRQLGAFLLRLQRAAPLPPPRVFHDELPSHILDFRQELDEIAHVLPPRLLTACRDLLGNAPPPFTGAPVFQHGDLGAEHILVDAMRGEIVGIIDWGDASWGNPVRDVVGLWAWGGDAAATAAQIAAELPFGAEDWFRLRFWGAAYAIGSAYFGYKDGRDALYATALGWLERMHSSGQLANPGIPDV